MIYYQDGRITVRDLVFADAQMITDGEIAQGWHQSVEKYLVRLEHQSQGTCISLVAEYDGAVAGYINVYLKAKSGPFAPLELPEIVDFGVLEKFRKKGIGTKLMDTAEEIAARYADTVCLGVGLHSGYGSAQRMYVKRGYIPDGTGVWYRKNMCPPYGECCNDDHLVLYLSKKLK